MTSEKWNKFFKEFIKLKKITPQVVKQKGIIGNGLIFACTADMCPGEVIDTDVFYPSYRHYKERSAGYFKSWIYDMYRHLDNYEYIAAAVVQAASCDIYNEFWSDSDSTLLLDIARSSRNKFGKIVWPHSNRHSWFFHEIDDYYADHGECEDGYVRMGYPKRIRTYKDAAKYIHSLMLNTFNDYQFVEVTRVGSEEEYRKTLEWTTHCHKYREMSEMIKNEEGIEEIYPGSPALFDGTVRVRCEKHGEYTIDIANSIHKLSHLCPECVREKEEAEAREKEALRQNQWKKQHVNDINNFIAMATQKFGGFYDYSLVAEDYKYFKDSKVRIIHPEYGIFEMSPHHHLRSKTGYCNSHIKSIPTVHDITYVLGGNGEKISVGDKVKYQDDRAKWHQGNVTEISNRSVTIARSNGNTIRKDRNFVFAA